MRKFTMECEDYDFSPVEKAFQREVKADCGVTAEVVITDEEEIRRLNNEMRKVDAVTDVLSFPTLDGILGKKLKKKNFPSDVDENGDLFIGSVAICEKRAKEQAEEYGHGYERELNYLAVHGVCHLLGYDHMTDGDKVKMRAMEEKILTKAGIERK
ncbi:MAG: rRNA maturation RNase YbeY [Clostridia bacterium]|nr:rRNA maturation RNase YbeY [Clostridia bacterium]